MIKVRAKKMLYYGHRRRKEGAVFFIKEESEFSESGMEKLSGVKAVKAEDVELEEEESNLLEEDVI